MNSMLQVCLQNQCLKEVQQNHTLACFSMYLAEYRLNRLLPPERATDLRTVETFKPCGGGSKSVYVYLIESSPNVLCNKHFQ